MSQLQTMYKQAAERCTADGIENDAEPNGAIHKWVVEHVHYRPPDTVFFIVQGIAAAMADLNAQREGFRDQGDRAAARMRESAAFRKHEAARIPGVR